MRGYTIQNSIDLLEKNGGGGSGVDSADKVSYDNKASGLVANNVQAAIDEVNSSLLTLAAQHNISSTETQIGTLNGDPLFAKTFETTITTEVSIVANQIYAGDVSNVIPADAKAPVWVTVSEGLHYMGGDSSFATDHWVTTMICLYNQTSKPIKGIAFYTKAAPVTTKTRKKK